MKPTCTICKKKPNVSRTLVSCIEPGCELVWMCLDRECDQKHRQYHKVCRDVGKSLTKILKSDKIRNKG